MELSIPLLLFTFVSLWCSLCTAKGVNGSLPLVIWHGMGDSCCNPLSMGSIKSLIEKHVPGIYVRSLMIGNNIVEDTYNGFLMNANKQIQEVCKKIQTDSKLKNGYNAIGFSQGGQFCQAGIMKLYSITNELEVKMSYKVNLQKLANFVMVMFNNDTMVQPKQTEWFGFYKPGQDKELYTLRQSTLYIEDRLGLRAMDSQGKLHFLSVDGDHLRFTEDWFIEKIINKFMK
ncbi:hypothetical protein LSH36_227g06063 [Paralvinella palmiformis]|uniref:Palmitoyl-protein thioesterase 1 n=1 Tax=Paralvinella palmiformis TaxID=53620 RepID=A0AAD9JNX9_9ANNE|nr:hypothetical protein LSH36_227g06063 [Paralvinella palmiformis]